MLVIAADDFVDEMKSFVDHKNSIGLTTVMVDMSLVGTNADDIMDYIQNYYETHPSLTYVLLVGDHAQVPTPFYHGGDRIPRIRWSQALITIRIFLLEGSPQKPAPKWKPWLNARFIMRQPGKGNGFIGAWA
jgi:hypothetical protein